MNHFSKIILAGCLGITSFYFAQDITNIRNTAEVYSNNQMNGTSKYNSMAGSMGALGGDISAANINPASVGVFISGDMAATLSIDNSKNTSTLGNASQDYTNNKTNLGQIGGIISFKTDSRSDWKFVNLGFNYSARSLDEYIRTPANHNIYESDVINGENINFMYNGHAYNRYGSISNLNIALGANYDHKVYVGGSLNFKSANIDQGDIFNQQRSSDNATANYNKQYTPYSEASTGVSLGIGAIGKLNNNFRMGVALETPTFWNINRTYTNYFKDGSNWGSSVFDESVRLNSPFKATLSAAYVANKNFALNVDYTTDLSAPKYKSNEAVDTQINDFFTNNYQKESELRVGGEYRYNAFRVRGGYAYRNTPFKNENLNVLPADGSTAISTNISSPYLGSRQIISGGIGYDFKSFYIDASIQNISSSFNNPFFGGRYISIAGNDGVENPSSILSAVKQTHNNISLTLGWKF